MRRMLVIGIVIGVGCVTAAPAAAAPRNTMFFDDYMEIIATGQFVSTGHIESNKVECVTGRKIDVFYSFENSPDFGRYDRAISSGNGAFAGIGPATDVSSNPVDQIMFKLRKKSFGRNGSKTCPNAAVAVNR